MTQEEQMLGEHITGAAVRVGGEVVQVPPPYRHHDALRIAAKRWGKQREGWVQGFVTSAGRFVDREEAYKIASKAGQLVGALEQRGTLFSEDLW